MNYIKTTISKDDYKEVEQLGNKFIVRVLQEEQEDNMVLCVETMIDHSPTPAEYSNIVEDATAYYEDLRRKNEIISAKREVEELKQKLSSTDYIAIKYAEGWITAEDYAPTKAQRQSWRDRINELENNAE